MVTNPARQAQQCPNCGGQGTQPQKVYRVVYDYVFPSVTLAALASGSSVLQIQFDADFEWVWIVCSRTGAFTIQLQDGSTGRYFSNSPVNDVNFAGTGQLPFPLVEPYLLARSTSISAAMVDTSNASNTVQLVFRGYKLFPQDTPQQGSAGQVFQNQTSGS